MKSLIYFLCACLVLVAGCKDEGQVKISDNPTWQAISYGAGRGMGAAILELDDSGEDVQLDPLLKTAADEFMKKYVGIDVIPAGDMLMFYNHIASIIGLRVDDPYMIIGDFTHLLTIFGASFAQDKSMTYIQPVPVSVMQSFRAGYAQSRLMYKYRKGGVK